MAERPATMETLAAQLSGSAVYCRTGSTRLPARSNDRWHLPQVPDEPQGDVPANGRGVGGAAEDAPGGDPGRQRLS